MEEIWKDIEGYEGLYQVSNFGKVRSLDRMSILYRDVKRFVKGRELLLTYNNLGYAKVNLSRDGRHRTFLVHRLVAQAFLPTPTIKSRTFVNHIDCNPSNNVAWNLEWVSPAENVWHAIENDCMFHIDKDLARKRYIEKHGTEPPKAPSLADDYDGRCIKVTFDGSCIMFPSIRNCAKHLIAFKCTDMCDEDKLCRKLYRVIENGSVYCGHTFAFA